jgi:hypothetical protein
MTFQLIPLGPPGPRYFSQMQGSETGHDDPPTFTINPHVRAYVQVTGVAEKCSKTEATFEVTVEQYISCLESAKDPGGNYIKPVTTFFFRIPNSGRYKNGKPVPGNKRFVSVRGFLTGVDRSGIGSEVEKFIIDMDTITFCGQYVPPVASMSSHRCTRVKLLYHLVTDF